MIPVWFRSAVVLPLVSCLVALTASAALAAAGDLDPTFGGDGEVITHFTRSSDDFASAVALQSNGKIVAAGSSLPSGDSRGRFAVARYRSNGRLDRTFGGDGRVRTHFARRSHDEGFGAAIQTDGKIIVAGHSNGRFALARYLANGALDPSFGGDGKVTTHFGSGREDVASAVLIQADGGIIAVGFSSSRGGTPTKFALARYTTEGSLDKTFGGDGKVLTHFARGSDDVAWAAALQADGKIVVAGWTIAGFHPSRFALARYNPNGSLDKTFGGDGQVKTGHFTRLGGELDDQAQAVAIQPDGKLVAAGGAGFVDCHDRIALARYNPNGRLDPSFSGDGKTTTRFSRRSCDEANGISIQTDGKIVIAGDTNDSSALARYQGDGNLDASFGGDGKVRTSFSRGYISEADGVALQSDGRVVTAGSGGGGFGLARYLAT